MASTRAPKTIIVQNINGATEFDIPFEFLARKFVFLTLLGDDRKELILNRDYRFVSTARVQLLIGTAGYPKIELRRITSASDRLVVFVDGSILRSQDLNLAQVQTIHIAEEARDLTADNIGVNDNGDLDARNRKIVNLSPGTDTMDAVNYGQLKEFDNSTFNNAQRAEASRVAAEAARDAARVSEANAGNHAVYARDRANEADVAKLAAQASATIASEGATVATQQAGIATQRATEAAQSAFAAGNSKDLARIEADRAAKEAEKLGDFNPLMDMTTVNVDTDVTFYGTNWSVSASRATGPMTGDGSVLRMGATNKQSFALWNRSSDNLMRFGWINASGEFTTRFFLEDDLLRVNGSVVTTGSVNASADLNAGATIRGANVLSTGAGSVYASGSGWVGCYPDSGARGHAIIQMPDELVSGGEGWHSRLLHSFRNGWTHTGGIQDVSGNNVGWLLQMSSPFNTAVKEWKFRYNGNITLPPMNGSAFVNQYDFYAALVQDIRNVGRGAYYPMIKQVGYQAGVEAVAFSAGTLINSNGLSEFCIHSCTEGKAENLWRFQSNGDTILPSTLHCPNVLDSGHRVFSPVNQPTHLVRKDGYAEYARVFLGNQGEGDFNLGDWTRFDIIRIFSSGDNDNQMAIDEFTRDQWNRLHTNANDIVGAQGMFSIVNGGGRVWIITSVGWGHYLLQHRHNNCRIRAIELGRYW